MVLFNRFIQESVIPEAGGSTVNDRSLAITGIDKSHWESNEMSNFKNILLITHEITNFFIIKPRHIRALNDITMHRGFLFHISQSFIEKQYT